MEYKKLIEILKKEFRKNNQVFYEDAWKDRIETGIKLNGKYDKLLEWLNGEIELLGETVNVFSPLESKSHTKKHANTYLNFIQNIGVLIHCKELLLEPKLTEKERENIEYTVCKLFNIHYNEKLGIYVG